MLPHPFSLSLSLSLSVSVSVSVSVPVSLVKDYSDSRIGQDKSTSGYWKLRSIITFETSGGFSSPNSRNVHAKWTALLFRTLRQRVPNWPIAAHRGELGRFFACEPAIGGRAYSIGSRDQDENRTVKRVKHVKQERRVLLISCLIPSVSPAECNRAVKVPRALKGHPRCSGHVAANVKYRTKYRDEKSRRGTDGSSSTEETNIRHYPQGSRKETLLAVRKASFERKRAARRARARARKWRYT